ncbi:serine/threonine-protein kinase [Elusimicrobium posterum]|uniref:PASTA domain-containing protein n=1 Tax=Elusimicrobium posterum TaxID=3116653 RepID=UPI003C707070
MRQLPSAGTIVREGRVIRVWISQSEEDVTLPVLTGMTLRNAQLLARQSGLLVGTVETSYSNEYDKGMVMDQTPKPAEMVKRNSIVNLIVSNGAPPSDIILMPEFRLKKLTEASRWASSNEVEIEIIEEPESAYPYGTITAQAPAADTEVKAGETIQITVSHRKVEGEEKTYRVHYEMAQGKKSSNLRIVLIDKDGEKDVMNEMKKPGSKIDIDVPYGGEAKIRIYVDGILVREREVK